MKRILLWLGCVVLPGWTELSAQASAAATQYVNTYKDIAIAEMQRHGIPASIKLGQGILESGAGNSKLARQANNHFGIKCKKEWTGLTFIQDDDARDECFRKYDNVRDSYEDHSKFLRGSPRYASLFELDPADYQAWAHGLKKAGYATNPQYAQLLIKTIEDNKLYLYDKPGNSGPESDQLAQNSPATASSVRPRQANGSDLGDFTVGSRKAPSIHLRNGVKYVVAREGDSYESLTRELDMMRWELYSYNDLPKTAVPKPGEVIYLQPKRRKASTAKHVVADGETVRDVSQLYAVKISRIRKLNSLGTQGEVRPGQVLKLR